MTPETPTPDYGEPWHLTDSDTAHAISRNDELALFPLRNMERAVACVNACVGMTDPATEIEVMREAIREAHEALFRMVGACRRYLEEKPCSIRDGYDEDYVSPLSQSASALAKLKPFIKP